MLQAGLLVLHMGRFEHFDKFLVLWFENSCNLARDFLYRPGFGPKVFGNNSNIRSSAKETRKSFTINFDIYIWLGIFRYQ